MVPLTWSSGYNQWYLIACGRRISENSSFLHIYICKNIYIYIYLIISHYNNTSCAWIFLNCISVTHFCQQQYSYWYMWYHAVTTILSTMNKTARTSLKEANIKKFMTTCNWILLPRQARLLLFFINYIRGIHILYKIHLQLMKFKYNLFYKPIMYGQQDK